MSEEKYESTTWRIDAMLAKITQQNIILKQIQEMLECAHRMGTDKDEPEGARYIQMSDTLAKELVANINKVLSDE